MNTSRVQCEVSLTVNGESRQKSSTANMIFDVPTLIGWASRWYTLHPGDIIMSGALGPMVATPARRRSSAAR